MAFVILSLTACEYKELAEAEINGTKYVYNQEQVTALYQNTGSQTSSVVVADDGTTAFTFTVNSNLKGTYICTTGSGAQATIHVHYQGQNYSTQYAGSSGTIDLVTTGGNLIEGTFFGTLRNISGSSTITVTNGKFSGRAY